MLSQRNQLQYDGDVAWWRGVQLARAARGLWVTGDHVGQCYQIMYDLY